MVKYCMEHDLYLSLCLWCTFNLLKCLFLNLHFDSIPWITVCDNELPCLIIHCGEKYSLNYQTFHLVNILWISAKNILSFLYQFYRTLEGYHMLYQYFSVLFSFGALVLKLYTVIFIFFKKVMHFLSWSLLAQTRRKQKKLFFLKIRACPFLFFFPEFQPKLSWTRSVTSSSFGTCGLHEKS